MKNFFRCLLFLIIATIFASCGHKESNLLDEIAGVWRAKGDGSMVSVIYTDKKFSLMIGEDDIPVSLADIDKENRIINLNVTLNDGKPAIWTIRQLWDNEHKSFHLSFIMHDGTQDELSFVRKISTTDLNRQANAAATKSHGSINSAAALAVTPEPQPTEKVIVLPPPVSEPEPAAVPVSVNKPDKQITFSPSFDCAKASNGAERLICSNQELAALDVEMMVAYKRLIEIYSEPDRKKLKNEQNEWIKKERNICSTSDRMADVYRDRIEDLQVTAQYMSKPAEFR